MSIIDPTLALSRAPRSNRRYGPQGDGLAPPSGPSTAPTHESIDPDFDAVDVDDLLRDLAIVPQPSMEGDAC